MKISLRSIVILCLLQCPLANAQQIYGLAKKGGNMKEVYLATVDPSTGQVTILSNSYITQHVSLGGSTLDEVNGHYYYYSPGTPTRLMAVEVSSGDLAFHTPLELAQEHHFHLIQFNCIDSSFYGIYRNSALGMVWLGRIDVGTGGVTALTPEPLASSLMDDYTYDRSTGTFYYVRNHHRITAFRLSDGELLGTTMLELSPGEYFNNIAYGCKEGMMYGTINNGQGIRFAKVDLSTAEVTVLSSAPIATSFSTAGGNILDEEAGVYYFNQGTHILTIDIATGNVVDSQLLSYPLPGNFSLLYIHKVLPCGCDLEATSVDARSRSEVRVHPNPVANELFIETNDHTNSSIVLYDISSRKILERTFTRFITLDLSDLAGGVYPYALVHGNGSVITGRIVKE